VNSGASAPPITLTVAVDPSANGSITNTATVTGSAIDANLGNNTASDTATLTPGFVFTDGVCVTGRAFGNSNQTCHQINWSPQIAGRNLNGVYITSVNTSTIPTQLSAVSATTINMEFGLSCINPIADANVRATFSATASALELCEASGATPTTWTPGVNLSFPAGNPSVGPYTFNYADVGQVSLYMRNSALTTQTGASGTFTVKPGGFVLSAIERNRDNFANPAATGPGGAAFVKAGEAFNVTVTATTCTPASTSCPVAGVTTPNYGQEAPPESVMLTVSNVTAGMIAAPAVGGGIFGAFNNGVATADGVTYLPDGTTRSTPFSWGEVGVIRLTPSVADGNYFLDGDTMGTASVNIGRFYPDHFDTVVQYSAATGIFMQCPAGLSCPAANYLADWSYANAAARVAATGFVATDIDRVAMQLDNNSYWRLTAVTPTWAQLVPFLPRGFVYSGQAFKVQVAARNVSGGTTQNYNSTSGYANPVTLNAWDALGSTTTQNPSGALTNNTVTAGTFVSGVATTSTPVYTLGTMPTAPIAPTDIFMRAVESAGDTVTSLRATPASSSEGGIKVLSGRIKVSNAYGSELLPLTLTATAQYYTATGWVNCLVDSVTRLVLTYGGTISPTPVVTPNPVSGVVSGGNVTVGIAAPGAGRTGTVTVTPSVDPASPGVPGLMLIPGTATFGVYKSNSGFIYRRESY
jgi:hypothetical protein